MKVPRLSPKAYGAVVLAGVILLLIAVLIWDADSVPAKAYGFSLLFGSQLLMSMGTYSILKEPDRA